MKSKEKLIMAIERKICFQVQRVPSGDYILISTYLFIIQITKLHIKLTYIVD